MMSRSKCSHIHKEYLSRYNCHMVGLSRRTSLSGFCMFGNQCVIYGENDDLAFGSGQDLELSLQ